MYQANPDCPYKSLFRDLPVRVTAFQARYPYGLARGAHPRSPPRHDERLAFFAIQLPYAVGQPDAMAHRDFFRKHGLTAGQVGVTLGKRACHKQLDALPGQLFGLLLFVVHSNTGSKR
jgi:hypothetical protein